MPLIKTPYLKFGLCLLAGFMSLQICFSEANASENSVSSEIKKEKRETLNKLNLLGYILTKSKRTRDVENSGNEKAISILKMARKHYDAAKTFLDSNEFEKSNAEIQKSLQSISVSFRMVVNKEREKEVAKEQYDLLYSRVKSFSDLFNQLPADKVKGILDSDKVNMLIKKSESLYAEGNPKQALEPLSAVADMLEQALSDARKNETIVYALEFETPEDEYKYEMERNENYTLLTNMIISTSPPENKKKLPLIRMLMNKNEELVVEAEKMFESGEVDSAIELLEKGNKTLVRALRLGGLTL